MELKCRGFVVVISIVFMTSAGAAKPRKNAAFPSFQLNLLQSGTQDGAKQRPNRKVASTDREMISTDAYNGRVVLVDFWASWCEPCKLSLPAYEKLQSKYKKKGFVVLAVNVEADEAKAREFLEEHKVNFPIAYDQGQKLATQLEIATMPTSFLIDRRGHVKSIRQGYREGDLSKLEKSIQKLL